MDINNMSRRERKKQKTKDNILRAARHLFEEKGFENTSIEEITEKADVSRGTFFNHFISKDSLLAGIIEDEVEDILFFAEEELKDVSGAVKKIRLVMKHLLEDSIPYLNLTGRVMFSSVIITPDGQQPLLGINNMLEGLVREGQKSGEITDKFAPGDIVTSILGGYYGIIFKWFELGNRDGKSSEFDSFIDILLQGIEGTSE